MLSCLAARTRLTCQILSPARVKGQISNPTHVTCLQLKLRQTEYLRLCYDADERDPDQMDTDWEAALESIRASRREAEKYLLEAGTKPSDSCITCLYHTGCVRQMHMPVRVLQTQE